MPEPEKTFDEVIAEAGTTLASRYAEAVAAQQAAVASATAATGTTPKDDKTSTTDEVVAVVETPAATKEEKPADDFDPQKTLSRYKTQEEKDAALVEKDRELLKRSKQYEEHEAEIARLKAENESLKTGKPAVTPAPAEEPPAKAPVPESKEFRPWLESVVLAEKPEELPPYLQPVREGFSRLSARKQEIESLKTKIGDLETRESALSEEIRTLDQEISAYDKALRADPDSLAVKDMLDAARTQKAAKESDLMRSQTSRALMKNDLVLESSSFEKAKDRYEAAAQSLHRDIREHETRSQNAQEDDARIRSNWNSAIKSKVLDRADLDADQKATIIESLEARLNRIDGDLPADFSSWIDTHGDVFAREQRKVAKGTIAVADRESGNAPRTPANGEISRSAPSPAKSGRKDTFDSTFDDAARKFAEHFARR